MNLTAALVGAKMVLGSGERMTRSRVSNPEISSANFENSLLVDISVNISFVNG